jgi:hypothetical protein
LEVETLRGKETVYVEVGVKSGDTKVLEAGAYTHPLFGST